MVYTNMSWFLPAWGGLYRHGMVYTSMGWFILEWDDLYPLGISMLAQEGLYQQ